MLKLRKLLIIIVSILIFIAFALVSSLSYKIGVNYGERNAEQIRMKKVIDDETHEKIIKSVRVKTIKNTRISNNIESSGRVVSLNNITISSEVQGRLIGNYLFKKGTKIKKGDPIFTIKDTDLKLLIDSKKSRFMHLVSSTLADIKLDFRSEYIKWEDFFNNISLGEELADFPIIENSQEKNFIISKSILSEYLSIKSDEEKLKKYTVVAPFDGVITKSYTDLGGNVNPGSPVVDFIRSGKMEVELSVPPEKIDLINIGDKVVLSDKEKNFLGKIIRKGSFINSNTQNVSVFAKINSNQDYLYSGMYLKANIFTKGLENVCQIPRRAIFGNNNIYALDSNNTLIIIKITITSSEGSNVIVSNIPENSVVVIEPLIDAKEKMQVTPIR